jgi:hypothetical protein
MRAGSVRAPRRGRQAISNASFAGHLETLETRRLFSLLGIDALVQTIRPQLLIDSPGTIDFNSAYSATQGELSTSATVNRVRAITAPGSYFIPQNDLVFNGAGVNILVNKADGTLAGHNPTGPYDLEVFGTVILGGVTYGSASVPLLQGVVTQFGFAEDGSKFDFRFTLVGGALATSPEFTGMDLGMSYSLDPGAPLLPAQFATGFSGSPKGLIAPIPVQHGPEPITLRGTKFQDLAGDGFTSSDPVLSGVTVNLFPDTNNDGVLTAADGAPIASAVTNVSGAYEFSGLAPATYFVQEVVPVGYQQTAGPAYYTITGTVPGQVIENLNFANFKQITITGSKLTDITGNGFSSDDQPLAGVTIKLYRNGAYLASTTTGADGTYAFPNLGPGTYMVEEVLDAGWTQTAGSASYTITATSGQDSTGNDFGNFKKITISGTKFKDITGNSFSADDTPLAGVTINLYRTPNLTTPVASTVTAADGTYSFADVGPGTYFVQEVVPTGYQQTGGLAGYTIAATSGAAYADRNFANFFTKGSISGKKFLDTTGNGLTADDTALAGIKIKLYRDTNNNGTLDTAELATAVTTTTAADGTYSFLNLDAGTYFVREDLTGTTYVRTFPTNSDTYTVTLAAGATQGGFNFANYDADCLPSDFCNVYYVINGCTKVYDLRGNTNQGDTVTVFFTYVGDHAHDVSLVSYYAPSSSFDANTASLQQVYEAKTLTVLPGKTYSITVHNPACYYQVDFVCGPVIDKFGPAGSNIFYSAQKRLISADNDGCNACFCGSSKISGIVYVDKNDNGVIDGDEAGIKSVMVRLTGINDLGQAVDVIDYTDAYGAYLFEGLRDGNYKVTETQPTAYNDGKDTVGSLGGSNAVNDVFSGIVIAGANKSGINYNFGELLKATPTGTPLTCDMTATIGFWQNCNGQALIEKMNGSKTSTKLGNWLAANFPNLFGNTVGTACNLAGKTNVQVGDAFTALFNIRGAKVEAQVMATALAIYATDSDLAGGTYAKAYGFIVNTSGTGAATFNVGAYGSAIGLTNYQRYTLQEILKATNNTDAFDASSTVQSKVNTLFTSINETGDI